MIFKALSTLFIVASPLLFSIPAWAEAATRNLVVINHSNRIMACAKVVIDQNSHHAVTYNWFVIQNGARMDLGETDFFYCEEMGNPLVHWSGYYQFCVSGPESYINPIYHSSRTTTCNRVGGDMRNFLNIPDDYQDEYTFIGGV